MSIHGQQEDRYKKVESILVTQPIERAPYAELEKKYNIKVDFRSFTHVNPLDMKEFRKQKIKLEDYPSVIFTGRNAVDNFFRVCEESRIKMSQDTRYFCTNKNVADYLQKFIVYRKRKVFFGNRSIDEVKTALTKFKNDTFLLPCSNLGAKEVIDFMNENNFKHQESMMYETVSSDLSDLADVFYDILVFFTPQGIQSLYENFPDFKQNETRIAVFGKTTKESVLERNLKVNIEAPLPEAPSMPKAIELYLQKSNK